MKILLIYPPWLRLFGLSNRYFPLNLGYLAAELRKHGHQPFIYNADFDPSSKGFSIVESERVMLSNYDRYMTVLEDLNQAIWQEVRETIDSIAPDVVGITSMTATFGSAINIAKCVKRVNKDIIVMLGGVHPTVLPEETIKEPEVDLVVKGEAEVTLVKIIEAIERQELSSIGLRYENDKYVINPVPGSTAADINHLAFPARDLLLNLRDFPSNAFGTIIGSRGCPFKCIFCSSHKMWGRKVRFRTPDNIVEEMVNVHETFGTDYFHFEDDTFTLKKDNVLEFCKSLKEKGIMIRWSCPTRVDFVKAEIVKEMKSAGCDSIWLGIESGSEDTLKRIRKGTTVEQARNAVRVVKDEGIKVKGYFVFGFPWETKEDIETTFDLIEELDLDIVQYNFAVPLPGTELFQLLESKGALPPHKTPIDWSQFYQHSPRLPFSELINHNDKVSIMEYIATRLSALNKTKSMLRKKKHREERFKYYLQHPAKIASRLYRFIMSA